jgi:hypothetical protein
MEKMNKTIIFFQITLFFFIVFHIYIEQMHVSFLFHHDYLIYDHLSYILTSMFYSIILIPELIHLLLFSKYNISNIDG